MYDDLRIEVLEKGGYVVQVTSGVPGSYMPHVAAFTTRGELLKWLDFNLEKRSPDLADRRPQTKVSSFSKLDDEIPF